MTLIEVRTGGSLVGRCDASCYNAKNPECYCVCGGANHGCGLEKAIENMDDEFRKQVTRKVDQHWDDLETIFPIEWTKQLKIFKGY